MYVSCTWKARTKYKVPTNVGYKSIEAFIMTQTTWHLGCRGPMLPWSKVFCHILIISRCNLCAKIVCKYIVCRNPLVTISNLSSHIKWLRKTQSSHCCSSPLITLGLSLPFQKPNLIYQMACIIKQLEEKYN